MRPLSDDSSNASARLQIAARKAKYAGRVRNSMNAEFVDTNILIYAHDSGAGAKHAKCIALLERLVDEDRAALSTQVLAEFYAAATKKLRMAGEEAEQVLRDLEGWVLHRPTLSDLLSASQLSRRHMISWWDALILNSAIELNCSVLWSEDLADKQRFGSLIVRNPFSSLSN